MIKAIIAQRFSDANNDVRAVDPQLAPVATNPASSAHGEQKVLNAKKGDRPSHSFEPGNGGGRSPEIHLRDKGGLEDDYHTLWMHGGGMKIEERLAHDRLLFLVRANDPIVNVGGARHTVPRFPPDRTKTLRVCSANRASSLSITTPSE